MDQNKFNITQLIVKHLLGELTAEENLLFQQWLEESDENKSLLATFTDPKTVKKDFEYLTSVNSNTAWNKVKQRRASHKMQSVLKTLPYAAILLLTILTGIWFWNRDTDNGIIPDVTQQYKNDVLPGGNKAKLLLSDGKLINLTDKEHFLKEKDGTAIIGHKGELTYKTNQQKINQPIYNTLIVPKTGTYRLSLPDGTVVWLNALTELKFPIQFGPNERKVFLKGEAYFEVAENKHKPFKVEVNGNIVKVLGTHFNIKAYDDIMYTTLLEGSVKVGRNEQNVILTPGQEAQIQQKEIHVVKADIEKATAWKRGEFFFRKDRMKDIMDEVARWYDLKIIYGQRIDNHARFTGNISRAVKLSEVLEMLSFVSGAEFNINEREVSINFDKLKIIK